MDRSIPERTWEDHTTIPPSPSSPSPSPLQPSRLCRRPPRHHRRLGHLTSHTRTHLHTLDCNSHSGNSVYSSRTCQSATWPVCRRPSSGGATATRAAQEHRTRSKAPHAPEPTHSSSTKRPDCCGLKEYMCKNAGPRANARDLALFGLLMLLRVRRCAHARALALEAAQECTRRTMGRDLTKSSRQGR